ncbi:MAG TPA: insulinase family protein [Gemmatimonadales bacterium]|nr:insulinase family protein [Gemmatimonadales bacterium]
MNRPDKRTARVLLDAGLVLFVSAVVPLAAQDSFPAKPPAPTPLAPIRFPPFQQVTLANGMSLLLVENHDQPVLSVNLSFPAGAFYDAAGKEGTAELVAEVLTKGTPTRTANQIAAAIEGVGGSLSASSGDDFLTVSLDVLSDHAELGFDLLGDVVRRATFPDSEVALARTRYLSQLALALSQPASVADRIFAHEVYGSHPYGRRPTQSSFQAITRTDITSLAAARIRPGGSLLVLAGDVTLAQAKALAERAFGGWTGALVATRPPAPPPVKTRTDILLVHRPGSVQGNIVIGNTTFLPTDTGYYPARVATQALGGGADSRLFLILREQKSWTYGAYAQLVRRRGIGSWEATFEGRTEVVDSALVEMLHQIDRIRTTAMPDSEITNVKGFLIGAFPLTVETAQQIASVVANARLFGLGTDYVRAYRDRLAAVTPARARAAASRTYHRSGLTIVVVGDAVQLYDRLKAIAPVRLVDVDGKPLSPADLHPKATALALDRAQVVTRSDSFRIVVQGNPMGAMTTAIAATADSLVYTEHTTIAGGTVEQHTVVHFNPADLSVTSVDQTGKTQGQPTDIHVVYAGGRVKGTATTPQQSGTPKTVSLDTTIQAGTYDDNALNVLIPALPLADGKSFAVTVFESGRGQTQLMQLKVSDAGTVTVPAGTYATWRLDVAGGQAPIAMYVTKETPRKVVKIEFVGAPFVMELVK